MAVAVEGEHGVDQVLDGPRPGQVAVLGDVAHQEERDAARLGHAGQALDAGAHLGQAAGGLAQLGVRDGLQRVDHHQGGAVPLDGRLDRLDVGPLNGQEVPGHQPDARGPARAPGPATPRPRPASRRARWRPATTAPGRAAWTCRCRADRTASVTEPATTPPPMTRSSSLTPVASGWMASVETSASASAGGPSAGPGRGAAAAHRGGTERVPLAAGGARPAQRSDVASHAAQR